jgi:hypothetical protein
MAAPAVVSDSWVSTRTRRISFTQSGANDGNLDFELNRALSSLVFQVAGTYAAGTIALQGSNDNSTFVALPTATSLSGTGVKAAVAADLGFRYYRLAFTSMDAGNTLTGAIVAKNH